MKRGHNFRELKIWKESIAVVKEIYLLTATLPDEEKFGLKSQMNRCSVSIPSTLQKAREDHQRRIYQLFKNGSIFIL